MTMVVVDGAIARRFFCLLGVLAPLAGMAQATSALAADRPELRTNEAYVEEATHSGALDVNDPMKVFAFVLAALPDRVKVYPTENYYYFRFISNGVPYAGNIRFDASDRDQGKVHFGYFQALSEWRDEARLEKDALLGASHGVSVERLDRFLYRLSYGGKTVVFALNDLSQVKPPPGAIGEDETFLGPSFDESGFRFFFVFNSKLKIFHFILDETITVPDDLVPTAHDGRILLGTRTGFAFYRDHHRARKILIGAYFENSRINNYFDGPFDQLPENFIEGDVLRDAIIAADPSVEGKIGRLGHFLYEEGRYLINPYRLYHKVSDLDVIDRCARSRVKQSMYYRCFVATRFGEGDPR
jgi:hypothetical protein